jgi:hypothetical protein
MKKQIIMILILIIFSCVALFSSCNDSKGIQVKNELDPEAFDKIDVESEAITPMYLPSTINQKNTNVGYSKSGLTASITSDESVLANLTFINNETDKADSDYPSNSGYAFISEEDGNTTINYRISDLWVCLITSDKISRQELEKVINSFVIRSVPQE